MKSFSYTELDELVGEVLPERAVLSTLLVGGGEDDNDNDNTNLNLGHGHGGGDEGTTAVVPQCQATNTYNQGLLGIIASYNNNSMACAGSTVVSGH